MTVGGGGGGAAVTVDVWRDALKKLLSSYYKPTPLVAFDTELLLVLVVVAVFSWSDL